MVQRVPIAASFAGGGAYGFGFNLGVAEGLRLEGIDLSAAPLIGTSAGSITAAALVTGQSFDAIAKLWAANESTTTGLLARATDLSEVIFPAGLPRGRETEAAVVRLFRWRRELLSSGDHSLADIVAASCSVFPVLRPHRVDGVWYVDGGHISNGSIDLAPAADLLLAVTPFRRDGMGMAGRALTRRNRREIAKWTDRHGGQVLEIGPPIEIAEMFNPRLSAIAKIEYGVGVYEPSVAYGRHVAAEIKRLYPGVLAARAA